MTAPEPREDVAVELTSAELAALGFQTPGSGGLLQQRIERIIAERERAAAVEALREAAEAWATGAWNDYFLADDVTDDVSAVRSMERFMLDRADRRAEQ